MPILARDWYDPDPDITGYYQGDIVRDVPVIFLPDKISKWFILRPDLQAKKQVDDVLGGQICKWFEVHPEGQLLDKWTHSNRQEFVAAKAQLMNVAILTQTCDIERRHYYQIAPIRSEAEFLPQQVQGQPQSDQEQQAQQKKLDNLRTNEFNYTFYLPAFAPYLEQNSYIELAHATLIPKAYFPRNSVREKLAARLTEVARVKLQDQLKQYFSRPFGFGVRDTVQHADEYLCVMCFYIAGQVVRHRFDPGLTFTPCETCGETRWIRPLRGEVQ